MEVCTFLVLGLVDVGVELGHFAPLEGIVVVRLGDGALMVDFAADDAALLLLADLSALRHWGTTVLDAALLD